MLNRLCARPIRGGKIKNDIAGLKDEVSHHDVDARRCVLDEDALVQGCVEVSGDGAAGFFEVLGIGVAEE